MTAPRIESAWKPAVTGAMALAVGIGIVVAAMSAYTWTPKLPGLEGFHVETSIAAGVAYVVSMAAAITVVGFLAAVLLIRPHAPEGAKALTTRSHALTRDARPWITGARRAAYLWLAASVAGIPLVAASAVAVPFTTAVFGLDGFLTSSQVAQLWLLQALVAAVVSGLVTFSRTVGGMAVAGYLTVLGMLPPVVAGSVSVGADHDLATDAALVVTIALTVWAGWGIAVVVTPAGDAPVATRRHQRMSLPLLLVVMAGSALIWWQGLAGTPPLGSIYGVTHAVAMAALVVCLVNWIIRWWLSPTSRRRSTAVDLVMVGVVIGGWVASNLVAAPRFAQVQSTQINYLGYEVPDAPTVATLLGPGRPNLLFAVVTLVALGLYWAGYLRLRRQGTTWPWERLLLWSIGWLILWWISTSGLWKFSGAAFSIHMGVHMAVNMLAPVFIVMGAPITLALRALPAHRGTATPGPRDVLAAVLGWRPLLVILHPISVWLYFVTAFYLLYFSNLFDQMMRYHWAHQFMTVHFLFTGLMFYGLVIGADTPPRPLPYVGKIGYLFSAMPFHAFFAVGILSSPALLAPTFYPALEVSWVGDLLADQNLGGQITWATGEIPMLLVIIALVFQWVRQDNRDAKRQDRAMDSGLDDSFEAYNAMLQRLAEQHGDHTKETDRS